MSSPELEVMFRVCARVHSAVRQALTSPHRADVVSMGAYGAPTQELDRIAERQIVAALESERVSWDVVSEEAGRISRGGDRILVVDPVDGSHNAFLGLPFSTVSLALGRDNLEGIEVGLVHDLATGVSYWAERGHGAFRDGQRIRTRKWDARSELFFVTLGRHSAPRAGVLAAKGRRIRALGCASLEMCLVAQGGADAYLFDNDSEERNLRVTDIAAGYRILIEAGGGASDLRGKPLGSMTLEPGPRTSVLAWGDPAFANEVTTQGYW